MQIKYINSSSRPKNSLLLVLIKMLCECTHNQQKKFAIIITQDIAFFSPTVLQEQYGFAKTAL